MRFTAVFVGSMSVVFGSTKIAFFAWKMGGVGKNYYLYSLLLAMTEEEAKKIRKANIIKWIVAAAVAVGSFIGTTYVIKTWLR